MNSGRGNEFPIPPPPTTTSFRPPERERRFRNLGNICIVNAESRKFALYNVESLALESGIRLNESGIPLMIGILPLLLC